MDSWILEVLKTSDAHDAEYDARQARERKLQTRDAGGVDLVYKTTQNPPLRQRPFTRLQVRVLSEFVSRYITKRLADERKKLLDEFAGEIAALRHDLIVQTDRLIADRQSRDKKR